jgi:hypothetical protein
MVSLCHTVIKWLTYGRRGRFVPGHGHTKLDEGFPYRSGGAGLVSYCSKLRRQAIVETGESVGLLTPTITAHTNQLRGHLLCADLPFALLLSFALPWSDAERHEHR